MQGKENKPTNGIYAIRVHRYVRASSFLFSLHIFQHPHRPTSRHCLCCRTTTTTTVAAWGFSLIGDKRGIDPALVLGGRDHLPRQRVAHQGAVLRRQHGEGGGGGADWGFGPAHRSGGWGRGGEEPWHRGGVMVAAAAPIRRRPDCCWGFGRVHDQALVPKHHRLAPAPRDREGVRPLVRVETPEPTPPSTSATRGDGSVPIPPSASRHIAAAVAHRGRPGRVVDVAGW